MCLLRDLHFTLLYIVVLQQFDKHLYLTRCLNAHHHNTFVPQQVAKDGILHYLSRVLITSTSHQCHDFRDHSHHQSHTASACNYPLEKKAIWGQPDYYLLTWITWTSCPQVPQPCFRARNLPGTWPMSPQKVLCPNGTPYQVLLDLVTLSPVSSVV